MHHYMKHTQLQCQVSKKNLLIAGANSRMFPHKHKSNKNQYQYKHLKSQNIVFTQMQDKVVSLNLVLKYARPS